MDLNLEIGGRRGHHEDQEFFQEFLEGGLVFLKCWHLGALAASKDFVQRRLHIRKEIVQTLSHRGWKVPSSFLDLNKTPQIDSLFVSLSHTRSWGAFVVARCPVGLDIEISDRVLPKVALRVSSSSELHESPGPTPLWVAKEASFKCLSFSGQPRVISSVLTGNWNLSLWAEGTLPCSLSLVGLSRALAYFSFFLSHDQKASGFACGSGLVLDLGCLNLGLSKK